MKKQQRNNSAVFCYLRVVIKYKLNKSFMMCVILKQK